MVYSIYSTPVQKFLGKGSNGRGDGAGNCFSTLIVFCNVNTCILGGSPTCINTSFCYCNSDGVLVSATVKLRLHNVEKSFKSVGISIYNDSFRAKNVANKCLHIMWVSDKRTAYMKEGQVQEYGILGAVSRSRRMVYVAVDPRTSYSV